MEYPNNSKLPPKSETPTPKVERVVSGDVKMRKKGLGERLASSMIRSNPDAVAKHVVSSVIIPSLQDLLFETGTQALQSMLFGVSGTPRNVRRGAVSNTTSRVNYQGLSSSPIAARRASAAPPRESAPTKAASSASDILFGNRGEAQIVLEQMSLILDKYDRVSVADVFDASGMSPNHIDYKWGWTNLSEASVRRVDGGFIIDLPRPEAV